MMRKIYTYITVFAAVLLVGGIVPTNADASASMGGQTQQHVQSNNSFQSMLHDYFNRWNHGSSDWQGQQTEQEQPETPEQDVEDTPEQEPDDQEQTDNSSELSQYEEQVVELTNEERESHGLKPLEVDNELSDVAREKSNDMEKNNYFDHNSPTYGSPFDMMDQFNIHYQAAGENIAQGQRTPEEVVNAWMNSDGHRENILNGDFTHIGVGFTEQKNTWTQQFIGK